MVKLEKQVKERMFLFEVPQTKHRRCKTHNYEVVNRL
jgi:hypothetical protein